jgi:hypothetical protein
MRTEVEISLSEIGKQLDSFIFPVVKNGGIVVPSRPLILPKRVGEEQENAETGKKRSAARARERQLERTRPPAGTEPSTSAWSPERSRKTSHATSIVGTDLRSKYAQQLEVVERAYPGTQHWLENDCIWLVVESALLPGVSPKANFTVRIPFDGGGVVQTWGFWGSPAVGYEWIGPRHTNFPDGSICAFEPKDQTWLAGDSIVALLDIYTLWALRHLHLRSFGRWPGAQAVHYSYERMLELRDDEYCGCANSNKLYGQCCKVADLALNQITEAMKFTRLANGGLRRPPAEVVNFIRERGAPPCLADLIA